MLAGTQANRHVGLKTDLTFYMSTVVLKLEGFQSLVKVMGSNNRVLSFYCKRLTRKIEALHDRNRK